jgi:hypothetical protein
MSIKEFDWKAQKYFFTVPLISLSLNSEKGVFWSYQKKFIAQQSLLKIAF